MISLCFNTDEVSFAVDNLKGSGYLKTVIHSYLEAYGTKFNFNEFYLQYAEDDISAVILRYNSYIYLICNDNADIEELSAFLVSFNGSVLFCDDLFFSSTAVNVKKCYRMSQNGSGDNFNTDVREITNSPKIIADLVTKDISPEIKDEFYLNTAHQMRHNVLRAFASFADEKVVSVTGFTSEYKGVSAITFVYTDEHFRGNGYSKEILKTICSDHNCEYQLLCEEHNLNFYKKCGFNQVDTCYEIRL